MSTKKKWAVSWMLEGTYEVEAATKEEAEEKFDKAWNTPRGVMPVRDGEITITGAEEVKP